MVEPPLVLCIERERSAAKALERVLTRAGYIVVTVTRERDALVILPALERLPDLILTGLELETPAGLSLLRALKRTPAYASIPVGMVSTMPRVRIGDTYARRLLSAEDVLRAVNALLPRP